MADHKGKEPHNLYADGQKGTNPKYREGYDRIFGIKPLPHGKEHIDDGNTSPDDTGCQDGRRDS